MLTFNDVLRDGGVDPAGVKLLRHTLRSQQILETWRSDRARVEAYQCRQRSSFCDGVSHLATFLVSRDGASVFGGLYAVEGSTPAPADDRDPITGAPNDGHRAIFRLTPQPAFQPYEDRLVVQWYLAGKHPGWWQWAHKNPKPIAEIATQQEQPFPSWLAFSCPVDELDTRPRTWREVLRATSGVYLLTDALGRQYVGSAKGGDGFLGRWDAHRNGRSGGDLGLLEAVGPFTVLVLQTFDPGTCEQTIERVESLWKDKLGARLVGYNQT